MSRWIDEIMPEKVRSILVADGSWYLVDSFVIKNDYFEAVVIGGPIGSAGLILGPVSSIWAIRYNGARY